MPLFSNTEQIGTGWEPYVREFKKLYEFHSLKSGSSQDFLQLAPKLASSEGFRLDFSDLVRTVRDSERERLSATDILTIVGLAIGGPGIAKAEMELCASVGTVQVLLAGVGGWRDPGRQVTRRTRGDGVARPDGSEGGVGSGSGVPDRTREAEPDPAPGREAGSRQESSPEMKETLARLELASMHLKIYLDDIDRRMGRIEPNLQDLTAMVHSSAGFFQGVGRDEGPSSNEASESSDGRRERTPPVRRRRSDETIAEAMEMASGERYRARLTEEPLTAGDASGVPEPQVAGPRSREEFASGEARDAEYLRGGEAVKHQADAAEVRAEEGFGEAAESVAPVPAAPIAAVESVVSMPPAVSRPVRVQAHASKEAGGIAQAKVGKASVRAPIEDKGAAKDRDPVPAAAAPTVPGSNAGIVEQRRAKLRAGLLAEGGLSRDEIGAVARVIPTEPRDRRHRPWVWGSAAAFLLVGAVSLAYVYHPWQAPGGGSVAAGSGAARGGGDTAMPVSTAPQIAVPTTQGSYSRAQNGETRNTTEASHGAGTTEHGSTVRKATGVETLTDPATQAVEVQPAGGVQGGDDGGAAGRLSIGAAVAPLPAPVVRMTPVESGAKAEVRPTAEPVVDRVEGARAADVVRVPRVESFGPDSTEPGGGTEAHGATGKVAARAPVPAAGPVGGAGDVPRSSVRTQDIVPATFGGTVISAPEPIYPQQARQLGIEGKVVIRATVGKSGTVTRIEVIDGPAPLQQSAEDAVRRRRYKPFLLHGEPTEFQTMVTIHYQMGK